MHCCCMGCVVACCGGSHLYCSIAVGTMSVRACRIAAHMRVLLLSLQGLHMAPATGSALRPGRDSVGLQPRVMCSSGALYCNMQQQPQQLLCCSEHTVLRACSNHLCMLVCGGLTLALQWGRGICMQRICGAAAVLNVVPSSLWMPARRVVLFILKTRVRPERTEAADDAAETEQAR